MNSIFVPPLGRIARMADVVMIPLMYALAGTRESPQRTHYWNNIKLSRKDVLDLNPSYMVADNGDPSASNRSWCMFPLFHAPILGGWRNYLVLQSLHIQSRWHIGWIAGNVIGVSQLAFPAAVRVLRGKGATQYFGVTGDGMQVPLKLVGRGRIGDGSLFGELPLL